MAKAGNATVGALRVILSADTAAFETGLKSARSQLATFGAGVGKAMAAVGAAVTAGLAAAGVAIKGALNEADNLGKAAQKFGVPVEQLSALKHAADLSDVSLETLGTGLRKLSQNMQQVAAGAKGPAAESFRALGISVTDANGNLRSSQDVLLDVAAKFAGVQDGANKTAHAMNIFGRSGTELIPLLNAGASGIREMMAEAAQLGIVITSKTAKAAETFNDNLTRLKSALDGVVVQVTAALAPALADLSDRFIDIVKNGDLAQKVVDAFGFVMQQAAMFTAHANAALAEFSRWGQAIGEVTTALSNADFAAAGNALVRARDDVSKITSDLEQRLQSIREQYGSNLGAKGSLEIAVEPVTKPDAPGLRTATDIKAENDLLKQQEEQARTTAKAWEDLRVAGQRVFNETRTPAEKLRYEIAELNRLLQAGAIDWETYSRGVAKAQADFDKVANKASPIFRDIARTVSSEISGSLQALTQGTFKWADALNSLLSILDKIAAKLIDMAISGIFDGNFLTGLFGGGASAAPNFSGLYASGGKIPSGSFGIAGEAGAEIIQGPANVIPVDQIGRGGGDVSVTVNNAPSTPQVQQSTDAFGNRRIELNFQDMMSGYLASPKGMRTMEAIFGVGPKRTVRG